MNFLRKFKDYVLGEVSWCINNSPNFCILRMLKPQTATQDLKSTSEASSEASSSSKAPAGFVQKVAVKQTVQPVLQNPGYGSSGGVQVMCCTILQAAPVLSRCTDLTPRIYLLASACHVRSWGRPYAKVVQKRLCLSRCQGKHTWQSES